MNELDTVLRHLQATIDMVAQQTSFRVSVLVSDPVTGAMVELHGSHRPPVPPAMGGQPAAYH